MVHVMGNNTLCLQSHLHHINNKAFPLQERQLKSHVVVSNGANGRVPEHNSAHRDLTLRLYTIAVYETVCVLLSGWSLQGTFCRGGIYFWLFIIECGSSNSFWGFLFGWRASSCESHDVPPPELLRLQSHECFFYLLFVKQLQDLSEDDIIPTHCLLLTTKKTTTELYINRK